MIPKFAKKKLCIQLFILIFSEKWPSIGLLDSHLTKSLPGRGGLLPDVFFCFQLDGPVTRGT